MAPDIDSLIIHHSVTSKLFDGPICLGAIYSIWSDYLRDCHS